MALVLVVDDEPDVRQLLGRVIRRAGHEVMEAESADAALAAMEVQPADVVFSDIQMPGHDGRWLTKQLRKRYPRSAVVLATSVTDLEPAMTLQFGVLSYLVKPFELDDVGRALKMAVEWQASNAAEPITVDAGQLEDWLNSLDIV